MALTDRAANAALNSARVASNVDIANPNALANQLDQRHVQLPVYLTGNLTASVTYRYAQFVADRAYKVISARLISPMPITAQATTSSAVVFDVVANNDANGADTILAQLLITTTAVGTFASQPLVVQGTNTINSGQQVDLLVWTGTAVNVPATVSGFQPYIVDMVVQEV